MTSSTGRDVPRADRCSPLPTTRSELLDTSWMQRDALFTQPEARTASSSR